MRIISSISFLLVGVGLVLSIISHSPHDIRSGEWFLPAPRSAQNLLGPFGAWVSLRAISTAGYFSIAIGLLIIVWGIGRMLQWRFILLMKITGFTFGWLFSLSLPVAAVGGEYKQIVIGKFAIMLHRLLSHTGSLGKILLSFGILVVWALWSTGIGFKRPAGWIVNSVANVLGIAQKITAKRRERKRLERQKILEQHRRRQEQIHRRIAKARTGNLVPGAVPEELINPPQPQVEQPNSITENVEEPTTHRTSPGLQDIDYIPPPIVSKQSAEPIVPASESGMDEEQDMALPFERTDVSEEVIVSAPRSGEEKTAHKQIADVSAGSEPSEKLPDWLMRDIPKTSPGIVDQDTRKSSEEAIVQQKQPAENQTIEEGRIEVIEPVESPGIEIDAAEAEEKFPTETEIEEIVKEEKVEEDSSLTLEAAPFESPVEDGILSESPVRSQCYSEMELRIMARHLFNALKTYRVDGQIKAITPGPVITRYEFEPAPGTKVSRVSQLADDLALALKARDVRIVAPLPGKGTVGIEVPNKESETVYIRSVFESPAFRTTKAALPLALGKGVAGEPVVADLSKMPHLLIAGATGSGKSVCINAIITSLLYKKTPMNLRLLLIDPKRLELSIYNGIPFLISPVVVENKEASAAFNWALAEMERRYKKLAAARVRKLNDFNNVAKSRPEFGNPLPHIVIIVDELADLMMTVANEIEEPIARLAQMARAVGIHLVLATQRPSVDVVTGIIKANFPSRIAFKVRSKIDSRTILDMGGAERLLGQGDMLYLPSGFADPIRIHGSYISTEETERLVEYLKRFPNPQKTELSFKEELARRVTQSERDELFWEAAKIIVMAQKGSASHLQRKLRVGYTRAASIIDQLEAAGIVGPFEGSKAREVIVKTLEELDQLRNEIGD